MTRGVCRYLVGSVVLAALIAVAGCSHFLLAEREPWRNEAETACIDAGVPQEIPGRVRIATISGPGACGIEYPLKVSEIGESTPLGYDDAPMVPPASIPDGSGPPQWPVIQQRTLPPPPSAPPSAPPYAQQQYGQPQYGPPPQYRAAPYGQSQYAPPPAPPAQYGSTRYGQPQYTSPQAGAPLSLSAPGISQPDDEAEAPDSPHPYYDAPSGASEARPVDVPASLYSPRPMMAPSDSDETAPFNSGPVPPLGPPAPPTATAGPVELQPAATLACPIVSALDKWVAGVVQPAALRWFRQPVVEIKQLGGYSCRSMVNGNPNAPISEHAFGNAIDIAEFDLADGHRISVQYGWHGTPEEQGFLHDVQGGACRDFTTVLAPGANVYHYNHIHVDLMRRRYRPYICEPKAIPGAVAAARARERYAAQHYGVTGSIKSKKMPLGYSGDDDQLPLAVPGDD
jgi:hypothetical protein